MFDHLHIPYRRERLLVGLADAGLAATKYVGLQKRPDFFEEPRRILLLRLERIGDLLMVLEAITLVRRFAPGARIDLVVGRWNEPVARLIPGIDTVELLDARWMAREGHGLGWPALLQHARQWRTRQYDLGINFEPDIRSNLLLAFSGAKRRAGFASGGGGSLLTDVATFDPDTHIAKNATALVARAFSGIPVAQGSVVQDFSPGSLLDIPDSARRRAADLLAAAPAGSPIIGLQPAAGRQIKEWDPLRFAETGAELARTRSASFVLIGSAADARALDAVRAAWPAHVPLLELPHNTDLVVLAALLERLSLFITGDTGPMHLAAAVGTPVLAIFGPSLPTRYAPLSTHSRIVRIDIPCSPCNLMRRPPARCVGHVPDCLAGIATADVVRAANEMLDRR